MELEYSVIMAESGMRVFGHILVPVDLSERNDRTADMARSLGEPGRAQVTLFHVIETIPGADYDEFQSFYRELEGRASRHLTALASRFDGSGLEVGKTIVCGQPIEEIIRFAVDHHVDLIVLASHKVDLSRPGHGWGTLSYKVGVLAPCPVMLVK